MKHYKRYSGQKKQYYSRRPVGRLYGRYISLSLLAILNKARRESLANKPAESAVIVELDRGEQ